MKITVDMVMAEKPCEEYPRERVEKLWAGRESLTPTEVKQLPVLDEARAWLLGRMVDRSDPTRSVARMIMSDCLDSPRTHSTYNEWLDTGDKDLIGKAWKAACRLYGMHVCDIVSGDLWEAAMVAAQPIAHDIAFGVANAVSWHSSESNCPAEISKSLEKYIGWMAEFLESV